MEKALFLDRDGVILKLVYDPETGTVDTARNARQVELNYGIEELISSAQKKGYLVIIISNQPGIGLLKFSEKSFKEIKEQVKKELSKKKIKIDGEYYCFHHPFAKISKYKRNCDCRKPKTGLFIQAAKDLNVDLNKSIMVGDGIQDIIAGYNAGCQTILIANIKESAYISMIEQQLKNIKPTHLVKTLAEITKLI